MFRHRLHNATSFKTYFDWFLLAFVAGNVNAGGYMACHRFVSHITGFATLAGIDWIQQDWTQALGVLTIPIYFLIGVMISAFLVDKRIDEGNQPFYGIVMGMVAGALALVAIGGSFDWFGEFGHEADMQNDYFLLALLCGASGLQNAALTSATGATIRTTHLTGITTDLGIGIIRTLFYRLNDGKRALEHKANLLRVGTIVSFMLGSAIGAFFFSKAQYLGFLVPSSLAWYATAVAFYDLRSSAR